MATQAYHVPCSTHTQRNATHTQRNATHIDHVPCATHTQRNATHTQRNATHTQRNATHIGHVPLCAQFPIMLDAFIKHQRLELQLWDKDIIPTTDDVGGYQILSLSPWFRKLL